MRTGQRKNPGIPFCVALLLCLWAAPVRAAHPLWGMDGVKAYRALQKSGKPAVLHFWAPWCGPCKVMHPNVEASWKKNRNRVTFVIINIDDPKAEGIVDDYDAWDIPLTVFENRRRKVVSYIAAVASTATIQKGVEMAVK